MNTSPRTTLARLNGQHIAMLTADHESALIRHEDGDLEVVSPFDAQAQADSDQVGATVLRYPAAPWAEDLVAEARATLLAAGEPAPLGTVRKHAADLAREDLAADLDSEREALALLEALPPLEALEAWEWLPEEEHLEVLEDLRQQSEGFCRWIPLTQMAA